MIENSGLTLLIGVRWKQDSMRSQGLERGPWKSEKKERREKGRR
jgi:hypothetical protein